MRYVTFSLAGDPTERLGAVVRTDWVVDVGSTIADKWPGPFPGDLQSLIQAGPEAWQRAAALIAQELPARAGDGHRLPDVRIHAPITRPRKNIFCLGRNYKSHIEETARARDVAVKLPDVPVFFTKASTSINGPYDAVPWDPAVTDQLDYEVELAAIIGVRCKNVARTDALACVFGYTILNDVSARDLQKSHQQWFKGKSLDGYCPMGPVVVTADEFGDPQVKRISLRLNGETRQDSTTANMIFPIDITIESLTRGMTLEPGDIIATGTPEGVGLGRTPPEYMKDGDIMETEVEGIGMMKNRIEMVRSGG
jgi:2-keto-4-pentenoate hydratase/2-oxohepta-3-ene-1,7-dioic acid hydratase in catechol pathway